MDEILSQLLVKFAVIPSTKAAKNILGKITINGLPAKISSQKLKPTDEIKFGSLTITAYKNKSRHVTLGER